MNPYVIVTDSCADMVPGFAAENHIVELELTYTIGGVTRPCNDPSLSRPAFYDMVRAGEMPITAQVNIEDAVRALTPLLDAGSDLLCIMFSSALSGTYNSVRLAAEELAPQYPTQRIIVLDSLAASAGQGMLVARAVMYREQGLSLDENAERIKEDIPRQAHLFTVDDLNHLHRGGRVSKTAAVFGTMLGIKPLLHVDDAGRLIPTGKVRGRRNSLLGLVEGMARQMDPEKCDRFAISHGDCIDDAQFVADEVCRRFGLKDYTISYVGPVIGAHSGPGTVALFFYAKHK
ncbi:DegV family protein [Anaerotruncus sp. DFI.9.16]|uniref:DegV family protein n=1 Tax=Anaerotruncus sp. DFI.9.16 TaxID=2965275 RepID=UPI00210D48D5|nr:DegV family protein [Anaerotruncus sp. DFI.9.16]MCQ4895194.1 DegV family protein [Anaerotruncus sp. DFI.9.16]